MGETYKSVTELMETARCNEALGQCLCDIVDFQEIIEDTPNADVVPVVRCSQCKYCKHIRTDVFSCRHWNTHRVYENNFCSYGERKNDNG